MSDPVAIAALFETPGPPLAAVAYGSGHIHETWVVTHLPRGSGPEDPRARSLLQRLNTTVFRDPEAVMANLVRVTDHVRARLLAEGVGEPERRVLTPLRSRAGGFQQRDDSGGFWRCFRFVEGARSYDTPSGPRHAYEAARAFGSFVAWTRDLPPAELAETIPHFHHLEKRAADLEAAALGDPSARVREVRAELELARSSVDRIARELHKGGFASIPRRVVHNDCKINNVLMDDATGEGLCVIDLDTVMEGTVLYDFGDLVRTAACPSPEDEVELARMRIDPGLYRALVEGYLAGTGGLLGAEELALLPLAGPLMALETGIRFLTDHVSGDRYFRVHRPAHNLDRARAQLRLLELLLEGADATRRLIADASGRS